MSKKLSIRKKKCFICGKPVHAKKSRYCLRCSKFAIRLRHLPHKTAKYIWDYVRKYGYVCYYTGMLLDMDDPKSPWYCVFDHWVPHDQRKIVLTSFLLNEMKSDLSEDEFWYYVRQLASFRRRHTKVIKKSLRYWDRDYTLEDDLDLGIELTCASIHNRICYGCGKRLLNNRMKFCPVCAKIDYRLQIEDVPAAIKEDIWRYIRKYGYICYYTKMPLDVTNPRSPWYCVFNHIKPCDPERKVVITSALLCAMKSGLSEKDFWYFILQLADYKEKHIKVRKKKLVFGSTLSQTMSYL